LSLKGIILFQGALIVAAFLLLSSQRAFGQTPQEVYQQSSEALYNLDFSIAEIGFERLTRDYPANPDYWNAAASTIWLKIIYDQQKLNIESFSGGAQFGTRESREGVNPADEQRLRNTLAVAMSKADAILKSDPNNVRALYALGHSNAVLASFEATVKRSYFTAHSKAKEARRLHVRVLDLDPSFHDARLAVGTYDYVVGVIPGGIRWFLRLLGVGAGDKAGGIRQLETTASQGTLARTDARMLLVVIYNREKEYDRALALIEELHTRYPRNFLFELSKASIYGRMKEWDAAVHTYQEVLAKIVAKQDGYDRLRQARAYYSIGTSNVERLQFETALEDFALVVSSKDATPDEKANAYLWMGKIFDSKKDRLKALQQYDALLSLNCDPDLKAQARRYKRRPFAA
jgi:tetratricopeptide (TPR) repeat protein